MRKAWKVLRHFPAYLRTRNTRFLVYTMGKVGSTSLYDSLRFEYPFLSVHHIHFLTEEGVANQLAYTQSQPLIEVVKRQVKAIRSVWDRSVWVVITLVRDPMARDISDIGEAISVENIDPASVNVQYLKERFDAFDHQYALRWFREELNKQLQLDVFNTPFDHKKKYSVYRFPKGHLIVLRLEDLADTASPALKEVAGLKLKRTTRANTSAQKQYLEALKNLSEHLTLTPEKYQEVYENDYAEHFYTPEERRNFAKRWVSNGGKGAS
ncbi:MAG: hypothetical protein KDD36_14835 [Flavobacteriales bacterium]|nr:hypothetical protein [Flavobacteriales bacterium]